jgi:hypothetical protein
MSLISFSPLQDGVTGVNAAATNTPLSTIYNDYNGNITSANLAANSVTTTQITDDNVTDAKLVNGKVYRRQGGSASDWDTVGTTTYDTSGTDIKIQSGTIFNNAAPKTITFPVAFTNKPLVIVSVSSINTTSCFAIVGTITASSFTCYVYDNTGSPNGDQNVNWVAIGI